jgi:hypothetical protein
VRVGGRCPLTLLALLGALASDGLGATSQPIGSRPAQVTSLGHIRSGEGFESRCSVNGHIAYVDQSDSGWRVIPDGWASPWVQGVLKGTLTLSPDGAHVACAVLQDGEVRLLHDAVWSLPLHAFGGDIVWSPDSDKLLYAGQRDSKWFVAVNESVGLPTMR